MGKNWYLCCLFISNSIIIIDNNNNNNLIFKFCCYCYYYCYYWETVVLYWAKVLLWGPELTVLSLPLSLSPTSLSHKHGWFCGLCFSHYIYSSTHCFGSSPVLLISGTVHDMCSVWTTGGWEQLVTALLQQWESRVSLFTVETPPPDGSVQEVWDSAIEGLLAN